MGAWSHEPFGNDTSCDWKYDLEEYSDLRFLEQTIDKALSADQDYLEASEGEEAIAAVEVIAKILGRGTQSDAYTADVDNWVKNIGLKPSSELIAKANKVLILVMSDKSELVELWEGQDKWKRTIEKLTEAINA
ncbi:DUF4259 domain-containing protein [Spartinivicinus ruber]|uniref:DUF4259 domain-containing protein n=1 Tax=Spartinivicinus ruber TaxID=2683272 RepID=UPI0013D40088|nr:DUF4259 domain-containing protein [Spartinivicinus ruber]